jgi:O-antigen/teichoic acid export membrane protein
MERLFVAEQQAERQAAFIAAAYGGQALVVILTAILTRRLDLIVWGLVAFAFARMAVTFLYCIPVYRPSLGACSIKSFKEQFSYAIPLGLATVVLLVFAQTDKYVIIYFLGRETFAVYSVGAYQLPFVDIVRNSIMNVVFPLMAQHQKEGKTGEILALWRRATLKTAVVFFPIFVFLEVSARPFVSILFTEEYVDATPVFMIYLLVFLRTTLDTTSVLMVFKKTAFMFKVNVVSVAFHIVFCISMYRAFGWLGVPAATVVAMYLQNGINLVKSARLLETPIYRLMPWGQLVIRFLVAALVGVGLYLGYRVYPVDSFIKLALAAACYFAVYLAIILTFRLITVDEIKAVFGQTRE